MLSVDKVLVGSVVALMATSLILAEYPTTMRGRADSRYGTNDALVITDMQGASANLAVPLEQAESETNLEVIKAMLLGTATIAIGAALAIWINDCTTWGKELDEM